MKVPFSTEVAGQHWYREASAWVTESLGGHRIHTTGQLEQERTRPWSAQFTVETSQGRAWLKVNCPAQAFEPALQQLICEIIPDSAQKPLAIESERGWMLTLDHGPSLGETREPDTRDWCELITQMAQMQQVLRDYREPLLATGLPNCEPSTVVDRFDRLVQLLALLPEGSPGRLQAPAIEDLKAVRPALHAACEVLAASPLPTTWQHADVHPWNMFSAGHRLRPFDFGDSQWANAIEVLAVPWGWAHQSADMEWGPVVDAYREVWNVDLTTFNETWRAAGLTQPVNRALTWWTCLSQASADEWQTWGNEPRTHLCRILGA